jgi:glucose-6-phosphate 1-dehydrogenase
VGQRPLLPHRQGACEEAHGSGDQIPRGAIRDVQCTPVEHLDENYLVIGIEPAEGKTLQFNSKVPGPAIRISGVQMNFRYRDYFKVEPAPGYETLIYDCMIGDNILFQRADGIEAAWQAVQPFLDARKKACAKGVEFYPAGSKGPQGACELLKRDGRRWRKL